MYTPTAIIFVHTVQMNTNECDTEPALSCRVVTSREVTYSYEWETVLLSSNIHTPHQVMHAWMNTAKCAYTDVACT